MLNVNKRGNAYVVTDKDTGLILRGLPSRKEAEDWANEAEPRRKDTNK